MKNITDYFLEYKSLQRKLSSEELSHTKKVKIALLSSSTIKGLKEVLFVKCAEFGVIPDIFIGEYNQYNQEIINSNSDFYKFAPDLVFLFIDLQSLLGVEFFSYYELADNNKKDVLASKIDELQALIELIKNRTNCKVVLHNMAVPVRTPLNIIDNKQDLGFIEFVKTINSKLVDVFKKDSQIFIFDYDLFCSRWGKEHLIDYQMYYIGDFIFNMKYYPVLCDEYIAYLKPLLSLTKKCIVLDLDNTLWGGVIGEEGMEGVKLGPTPEGRPFMEFQQYLLSLFNRGVILAINSKNNPQDALEAIRKHPNMIIREDKFASIQINWNDKATNLKTIASELNIGLDSLVFFDDDQLNREMVKSELPEVKVVELPEDPSMYLKTLMNLSDFNLFNLSDEDKRKGQMYTEQRQRKFLSDSSTDMTSYLKALNIKITIEKANKFNIPRISQLTQKTNQFNLTTKRYMEEDIKRISNNDDYLVFCIQVEDKFGDNGIVGNAIVEKKSQKWIIDTFLLSCRVIGRRIEDAMLCYILKQAEIAGAKKLIGHYIPTKKNIPAKDFYTNNGFLLCSENENEQTWIRPIEKWGDYINLYKVIEK